MRGVRDAKDSLEIQLSNQQVFFFLAALVAYSVTIFMIGMMIGKSTQPIVPAVARLPEAGVPDAKTTPKPEPAVTELYQLDKKGHANSIVKAIPEKATPEPRATAKQHPTPAPAAKGRFAVQAAAYAQRPQAEVMAQKIEAAGLGKTFIATLNKGDGRTFYRVRVGPYASKDDAESALRRIRNAMGITPAIVQVDR